MKYMIRSGGQTGIKVILLIMLLLAIVGCRIFPNNNQPTQAPSISLDGESDPVTSPNPEPSSNPPPTPEAEDNQTILLPVAEEDMTYVPTPEPTIAPAPTETLEELPTPEATEEPAEEPEEEVTQALETDAFIDQYRELFGPVTDVFFLNRIEFAPKHGANSPLTSGDSIPPIEVSGYGQTQIDLSMILANQEPGFQHPLIGDHGLAIRGDISPYWRYNITETLKTIYQNRRIFAFNTQTGQYEYCPIGTEGIARISFVINIDLEYKGQQELSSFDTAASGAEISIENPNTGERDTSALIRMPSGDYYSYFFDPATRTLTIVLSASRANGNSSVAISAYKIHQDNEINMYIESPLQVSLMYLGIGDNSLEDLYLATNNLNPGNGNAYVASNGVTRLLEIDRKLPDLSSTISNEHSLELVQSGN